MRWSRGGSASRASLVIALAALVTLGTVGGLPSVVAQNDTDDRPPSPDPGDVWTVETHVDAVVVDNYATVNITVVLANEGPDPEFPFEVRVPDDAFITGLTIERDGQIHEAEIKDRGTARQDYEDAKDRQQSAGLIEKARTSSVYSYLINVEAFETVTATLTYERYLAADQGVYSLPLTAPVSGFGRDMGATFDVTVRHSDGVTSAWSEQTSDVSTTPDGGYHLHHEVGPRQTDAATPFDLNYTVAPTDGNGTVISTIHDGTGYFAHRFRAPVDARDIPVDLTMVLDTSGSMNGLKISQLQDAARQVVANLDESDRLNIVSFASGVQRPWQGLEPADDDRRAQAVEAIESLVAGGSTNIEAGIHHGFDPYPGDGENDERLPVLIFLTDGQPTVGTTDADRLRAIAQEANDAGVHVFALAFGHDADWGLVHGLADDGNGTAVHVPEGQGAEVDLRRFMAQLTAPVLRDVQIRYAQGIDALNTTAPVLFAGSELLVVGTFDPNLTSVDATVDATSPEGARTYEISEPIGEEQASFLPRLVAYHQVRELQTRLDAQGHDPALVENITRLSLEHGFVTEQTSLVVTLPPQPDQGQDGNVTVSAEDDGHGDDGADQTRPLAQRSYSRSGGGTADGAGGAPADPGTAADRDGHGTPDRQAQSREDPADVPMDDGEEPQDATPGLSTVLVAAVLAGLAGLAARRHERG